MRYRQTVKDPYPINVMYDVLDVDIATKLELPEDFIDRFEMACALETNDKISDMDVVILFYYYADNLSISDIVRKTNLTRYKIKTSIEKSICLLKKPERLNILLNRSETEMMDEEIRKNLKLDDVNELTASAKKQLKRMRLIKVQELESLSVVDIIKIPALKSSDRASILSYMLKYNIPIKKSNDSIYGERGKILSKFRDVLWILYQYPKNVIIEALRLEVSNELVLPEGYGEKLQEILSFMKRDVSYGARAIKHMQRVYKDHVSYADITYDECIDRTILSKDVNVVLKYIADGFNGKLDLQRDASDDLSELEISTIIRNKLISVGITTISELIKHTKEDLIENYGIGGFSANKINSAVCSKGLSLKESLDDRNSTNQEEESTKESYVSCRVHEPDVDGLNKNLYLVSYIIMSNKKTARAAKSIVKSYSIEEAERAVITMCAEKFPGMLIKFRKVYPITSNKDVMFTFLS